jgi:hypothetical protein
MRLNVVANGTPAGVQEMAKTKPSFDEAEIKNVNVVETKGSMNEAEIQKLLEAKKLGSMTEAEIQNLLAVWTDGRRKVWDALFSLVTANTPPPWKEFMERSVGLYEQTLESLLTLQAAGVATVLRAFGPLNNLQQLVTAWDAGMSGLGETVVHTERRTGEAVHPASAERSSAVTAQKAHAPSKAA